MTRIFAALAFAATMSAMPLTASFAEESGSTGGGAVSDASKMALGVDISAAGTTDESRKAFWDTMKPEDQAMVTDKCNTSNVGTSRQNWTAEMTSFCAMLQK